jgi:hypothetical protein
MSRPALRVTAFVLVLGVLFAPLTRAWAAWPHDPTVNLAVCASSGDQWNPVSVTDGAGGVIVAWYDWRSGNADVYAQRYDAYGRALWTASGVLVCGATGDQTNLRIVTDNSSGAILGWQDGRGTASKVFAQRVNSSGTPLWTANGVGMGTVLIGVVQTNPAICSMGSGTCAIAWEQAGNIYAQRLNASGVTQWGSSPMAICTATGTQQTPIAVYDPTAGNTAAFFAWRDDRNGNSDLYAQRVLTAGTLSWIADGTSVCTAANEQSNVVAYWERTLGVVLAWMDWRAGNFDIYALRITSDGVFSWGTSGVAVCTASGDQWYPRIVTGGTGKAIIGWVDWRTGSADVYAQELGSTGVVQWTANGAPLCTKSGNQSEATFAIDGSGGVIAAWRDERNGVASDLWAQRLDNTGTAQWATDGVAVSRAFGEQTVPFITSTGSGTSVVTWMDQRGSDRDIYAQGLDAYGLLGIAPVVASVRDVPNDQGGRLSVRWDASPLDAFPGYSITRYRVYAMPPAATVWTLVDSMTAAGLEGYSRTLSTTVDSAAGANPRTAYRIEAYEAATGRTWTSAADSGYSVDNLSPLAPGGFAGTYESGSASLTWTASEAPDLAGYRLYRGVTPDFTADEATLIATPVATSYTDAAGAPYYYRLSAVDTHGNPSTLVTLLPSGAASAGPLGVPRALALSAPAPNPLRGSATLRLALPRGGRVSAAVFDQQGRRVRALLDAALPAGEHPLVWDGRDDAGRPVASGLYFVQVGTDERALTRRLAVVR